MPEPTHAGRHWLAVQCRQATAEALRGRGIFGPFASWHEALAVLEEEVDELKAEIRRKNPNPEKLHTEAVQVAGLALRIAAWAHRERVRQEGDNANA